MTDSTTPLWSAYLRWRMSRDGRRAADMLGGDDLATTKGALWMAFSGGKRALAVTGGAKSGID